MTGHQLPDRGTNAPAGSGAPGAPGATAWSLGADWYPALVAAATQALPAHVAAYIASGARRQRTREEAEAAWAGVRLAPRVFSDVRRPDTGVTLLGQGYDLPVGIAPTSLQLLAHPDGEPGMVRAAHRCGVPVVVSSNSGTPFAALAQAGERWWLQAYLTADRSLIVPTLLAARDAGAAAVVLTADTPFPGPKPGVVDADFGDLSGVYGVNHPAAVRGETPGAEHARDLGPADVAWLRDLTGLPVVVKGVLRADDARRCRDAGAAAVWVSNHGGRQYDGAIDTVAALSAVAPAVGEEIEVYVDGGLRSGYDVAAALALGARAAFLGRPALYALAAGGSPGVQELMSVVGSEFREAMALAGAPSPDALAGLAAPVLGGPGRPAEPRKHL
ncbi:alpha-hydroxy acid oxidase [Nocardioides sp.]|uniref:alpha-hydroxy acid oxidase n=1 Tax=Nocardioides sp. TaxID=35761 RepID=UPI0035194E64